MMDTISTEFIFHQHKLSNCLECFTNAASAFALNKINVSKLKGKATVLTSID